MSREFTDFSLAPVHNCGIIKVDLYTLFQKGRFMAEKDIFEKTLEDYNDVFADIVNVLLFHGKLLVKETDLEEETPYSSYKADGKLHAQERDVAKYWRSGLLRIAFYGFENQTGIDTDIPLRLFAYDGAAYRAQLLTDADELEKYGKKAPRYPVVTLVLYFGYNRQWKTPTTLTECLSIPEDVKPYVNDYKMNLFQIAYLSNDQVQMFQSDFKIVADYFVQMRKNHDYIAPDTTIKHVHELLQLMSVMTKDNRFKDVYSPDMKGGETKMCEVLDRIENRGIAKGISQGIAKGISQGENSAFSLVKFLMDHNRLDDLKKASEDESYRSKLMTELPINSEEV